MKIKQADSKQMTSRHSNSKIMVQVTDRSSGENLKP